MELLALLLSEQANDAKVLQSISCRGSNAWDKIEVTHVVNGIEIPIPLEKHLSLLLADLLVVHLKASEVGVSLLSMQLEVNNQTMNPCETNGKPINFGVPNYWTYWTLRPSPSGKN